MTEQQQPTVEPVIFAEDAEIEEAVILPETEETDPIPEELPETEEPKRRRGRGFRIALLIITVLLVIAVALGLWNFKNALADFEATSNEPPLDAYMELIKKGDYETLFASSGFRTTGLNSKEHYIAYLRDLYADVGELSVTKELTADSKIQRYHLYSDGKDKVATLLVTSDVGKDGKTTWYITTELTFQPTYTVTASADIDLYINGQSVALLSEETVTVTEMQSSIFGFATDIPLPVIRTYTINGLLLPPEIEATGLSGNACIRHEDGRNLLLMLADDDYDRAEHEKLATDLVAAYYTADGDNLHELTVENYRRYSEDDFSCTVTCAEVTTSENGMISVGDATVAYDMTFLRSDDGFVLCSLAVDGVEQAIPELPAEA